MNKKFLTVGMIMPFVAAVPIFTAPAASAAPHHHVHHNLNGMSCTLHAKVLPGGEGDRIKVKFKLYSNQDESRNFWKVEIWHNSYQLVRDYMGTVNGRLSVVHMAGKTSGTDRFTATATNLRTDQQCRAEASVR